MFFYLAALKFYRKVKLEFFRKIFNYVFLYFYKNKKYYWLLENKIIDINNFLKKNINYIFEKKFLTFKNTKITIKNIFDLYYFFENKYKKFCYYFFLIKEYHLGSRFKYKYRKINFFRSLMKYKIKNKINLYDFKSKNIFFIKKPFFEKNRNYYVNFLRKDKFYLKSFNQRVRQICQNTVYLCLSLLLVSVIMSSTKLYFFEKNFFDMNYFYIFLYFLNFFVFFKFKTIFYFKKLFLSKRK